MSGVWDVGKLSIDVHGSVANVRRSTPKIVEKSRWVAKVRET